MSLSKLNKVASEKSYIGFDELAPGTYLVKKFAVLKKRQYDGEKRLLVFIKNGYVILPARMGQFTDDKEVEKLIEVMFRVWRKKPSTRESLGFPFQIGRLCWLQFRSKQRRGIRTRTQAGKEKKVHKTQVQWWWQEKAANQKGKELNFSIEWISRRNSKHRKIVNFKKWIIDILFTFFIIQISNLEVIKKLLCFYFILIPLQFFEVLSNGFF